MFYTLAGLTVNLDKIDNYKVDYNYCITGNVLAQGIIAYESGHKEKTHTISYWKNPEEFLKVENFRLLLEHYSSSHSLDGFSWDFDMTKISKDIAMAQKTFYSWWD